MSAAGSRLQGMPCRNSVGKALAALPQRGKTQQSAVAPALTDPVDIVRGARLRPSVPDVKQVHRCRA
ncbi:hypothetical protein [Nocardia cyriacigeorgica]|uniref:hypothetical protein n=1 Tax=Nocardia cyriacigeorgica TaxID=135487 RepID=UPI00245533B7|nr:hypothetical protein [Nocardia cyriacigeorgica]